MCTYEEVQVGLADQYEAYGRYWPVEQPRGAVLYHPGIQSHCGWFERSGRRLAAAGFAVLQVDRRGTGRNETARGHAESAEQLIEDAELAKQELRRRSGCEAVHVLGVSWGGKLSVCAYVAEPEGVLSLSLVAPGLFPIMTASAEERQRIGMAMLYEPDSVFDIPLNEAEMFTDDPEQQQFFREDPLTLRAATAGFYLASRRMDKMLRRLEKSPPVPIHLMMAGDERIVLNGETEAFVEQLGWPGTRIKTYEQARHSLEWLPEAHPFFDDLVEFIEAATAE
jgi:alpha-beta hydrolase superfamily lysophospholipase